jgi:hypothetical protein
MPHLRIHTVCPPRVAALQTPTVTPAAGERTRTAVIRC